MKQGGIFASLFLGLMVSGASAQEVRITPDMMSKKVVVNGQTIEFKRNQNQGNRLSDEYAKTSRACPPFCVQPMEIAPGLQTIGELELLDFLDTSVAQGRGLLIDARLPEWFEKGAIPGAINLPFSTLEASNPYRTEILSALGGTQAGTRWDFTNAFELAMYCNGPWCGQASRAISGLLEAGYPEEKIKYYRGGMQSWLLLGLNTTKPNG